jgi:hypothetical protein
MTLFFWICSSTSGVLSFSQQIFQIAAYYDPNVNNYSRWAPVGVAWGLILYSFLSSTFHVRIVTMGTQFCSTFYLQLLSGLGLTCAGSVVYIVSFYCPRRHLASYNDG